MMKYLSYLSVFVIVGGFFSCATEDPIPEKELSNFSIKFSHTGKPDRFIFSLATITQGGSGWEYEDGTDTNPGFNDLGLTTQHLTERNPLMVKTKSKIKSFTVQYNVIYIPNESSQATLTGTLEVSKDGNLIDSQTITVNEEQKGTFSYLKEYK